MERKLIVEKGTGEILGQALRQLAMGHVRNWRPIAFTMNREFNLISGSSAIVEDTHKIISKLTKLTYKPKDSLNEQDIVEDTFAFTRVLKPENMQSNFFEIRGSSDDLIHCLDPSEVVVRVVYRLGSGVFTADQNQEYLVDRGFKVSDYQVLNSRHTTLTHFVYDVGQSPHGMEELTLKLGSDLNDEAQVLNQVGLKLKSLASNFVEGMKVTT